MEDIKIYIDYVAICRKRWQVIWGNYKAHYISNQKIIIMKKLFIAVSLLMCFSFGAMSQSKHKKHHGKKHQHHMSKKDDSKSDKTDK